MKMLKLVVLLAILSCVLLAPLPQINKQLGEQQPQQPQISSYEDSTRPAFNQGLRFGRRRDPIVRRLFRPQNRSLGRAISSLNFRRWWW